MKKQTIESEAEAALVHAKQLGADQAAVTVSSGKGFSVKAQNRSIETVEHYEDQAFSITVFVKKSMGSATTNNLSKDSLLETTEKALSLASLTAADEFNGLADSNLMATEPIDLDLHHPWKLDMGKAQTMALECEQAALESDPKVDNSEGATVGTYESHSLYANSHGFVGATNTTGHTISCTAVASENGSMEMDYEYSAARKAEDLLDHEKIGYKAGIQACSHLGARKIKTQKAQVLYSPRAAKSLISHITDAISGTSLYRKASFLLDSMDQHICPDYLTITEQPHLKSSFGSTYFDGEGVKTKPRTLVEQGVLRGYLLSSYSARRLGLTTTGNAGGHHNLLIEPTLSGGLEEIIRTMTTGLVVTDLIGYGVNILNGDYSRGANGFWVENGEIQYPVSDITIAGNLKNILQQILVIGYDCERNSAIHCGSILIDDMMVAGQ